MNTTPSEWASIRELRVALADKKIMPSELIECCHARITQYDTQLGALLETFSVPSSQAAQAAGPLAHIPGVFKDTICIKDRLMTCASRMLEGYRAPYSATVTTRIERAGGIILGRANCDEFAMGSSTETSAWQTTRNPWDNASVPGGSSGGSAVAVAAGFVPWALGSETGGSVRQPAAWCGIVGSKPTYGLVSRYGVTAYASSLDQVGVCTRTVYDNALVLSVIAGRETPVRDSTARELPASYDLTQDLTGAVRPGLKIGVIEHALTAEGMSPEVVQLLESAIAELQKLGVEIVRVSLPSMELSAATYFVVSRAEAASNLARFDGVRYPRRAEGAQSLEALYTASRSEGFGDEVQRRIMIGNYVLSRGHADAFYRQGRAAQARMRAECDAVFQNVDLLFAPVVPTEAYQFGSLSVNSLQLDLQDYFTCFANLVGIPAVSVPCGLTATRKMPIGFQLMGPHWSEALIFQTAHAYEQATEWHTLHPPLL
jgi:aspartyl-tRNA(Asn)/glutamyl-tRNA(Gln) amidotransferase subunit A